MVCDHKLNPESSLDFVAKLNDAIKEELTDYF